MISVTRLDGSLLVVNADLVLTVEKTPDTMIRLTSGDRFLIREPVSEVIEKVVAYQQRIRLAAAGPERLATETPAAEPTGDK